MFDVKPHLGPPLVRNRIVQNRLLATLPPEDFRLLAPHLKLVQLKRHDLIYDVNKPVAAAYFVETGLISRVARTSADDTVEVAMVGRFSFVGIGIPLGTMVATGRTTIVIPGAALRIAAEHLVAAMKIRGSIRDHLLRYVHMLLAQTAQVSFCNARHSIEQRIARWLLQANDRVRSGEVQVTHEMLSIALGIRRAGVTETIAAFESDKIVAKERGLIRVLDCEGLRKRACDCYGVIDERMAWLRQLPQFQHVIDPN